MTEELRVTKLLARLHQLLFHLLILFIPTQLGKHFWPDWAMVEGIRIDYLSPTIYATDLLVLGILVSWGVDTIFKLKTQNSKLKTQNSKLLFFLILLFVANIYFSQNKPVAFLKWLKIIELILLTLYVKSNITTQQFNYLTILFSLTIIYSSIIAWLQFLKQASINTVFWWLGERAFTLATPGIAQMVLNGRLLLRPYGTFSHPNVLAGYLAVALSLIIANYMPINTNCELRLKRILSVLAVVLGMATLLITFSRAGWIVGGTGIVISLLLLEGKRKRRLRRKRWLLILTLFLCFFVSLFLFSRKRLPQLKFADESLELRQELNKTALLMVKKYPLTGVGLNNFIPSLPQFKTGLSYRQLQPVHNIYLLIGSESGLVGLGVFLWLIYKAYQKLISKSKLLISNQIQMTKPQPPKKSFIESLDIGNYLGQLKIRLIRNFIPNYSLPLFISFTSILLLGLFDHYFFTLQQTQLLLAIVLGMVFGLE